MSYKLVTPKQFKQKMLISQYLFRIFSKEPNFIDP